MSKLVTVAVAVYNAEKYLEKCLDTIINQTYRDIEILLVNDGSKDNSLVICERYAALDERIKIINKENGGLSSSRNEAINNMRGDYLMFVDCDDWVELNIVEFLYSKIEKHDLDMAICSGFDHDEITGEVKIIKRQGDVMSDANRAMLDFYNNQNFMFDAIQCKLYRKEIIKKIFFKLGRTTDDTLTTPLIIDECKKIGYFDEPLYNYLIRRGSMTRTTYNSHNIDKVLAYSDNIELIQTKYSNALDGLIAKMYSAIITNQLKIELLDIKGDYCQELNVYKELTKQYSAKFSALTDFSKCYYILSKCGLLKALVLKLFNSQLTKFLQI